MRSLRREWFLQTAKTTQGVQCRRRAPHRRTQYNQVRQVAPRSLAMAERVGGCKTSSAAEGDLEHRYAEEAQE